MEVLAGGVLKVEILEKREPLWGDAVNFYIKIKAVVSIDNLENLAKNVKSKNIGVRQFNNEVQHLGEQKGKCYLKCLWEKRYNHLKLEERDTITVMKSEGKTLSEIAGVIGRDKGTIYVGVAAELFPEYKLYLSHRAQGELSKGKGCLSAPSTEG